MVTQTEEVDVMVTSEQAVEELFDARDEKRIHQLAQSNDPKVLKHVLFNAYVADYTIAEIAKSPVDFPRKMEMIADQHNASAETLTWVYKRAVGSGMGNALRSWLNPEAKEDAPAIKAALAKNPNTPPDIREKLLKETSENVLYAATENPAINDTVRMELLSRLSRSNDYELRLRVVNRKELPDEVRKVALADMRKHKHGYNRAALATCTHLDLETVQMLSSSGDMDILNNLYRNENLSPAAYKVLAETENFELLALLGSNKATPVTILDSLALASIQALKESERLRNYAAVACRIAINRSASPETLDTFVHIADEIGGEERNEFLADFNVPSTNKSLSAKLRYLARHNPSYKGEPLV